MRELRNRLGTNIHAYLVEEAKNTRYTKDFIKHVELFDNRTLYLQNIKMRVIEPFVLAFCSGNKLEQHTIINQIVGRKPHKDFIQLLKHPVGRILVRNIFRSIDDRSDWSALFGQVLQSIQTKLVDRAAILTI